MFFITVKSKKYSHPKIEIQKSKSKIQNICWNIGDRMLHISLGSTHVTSTKKLSEKVPEKKVFLSSFWIPLILTYFLSTRLIYMETFFCLLFTKFRNSEFIYRWNPLKTGIFTNISGTLSNLWPPINPSCYRIWLVHSEGPKSHFIIKSSGIFFYQRTSQCTWFGDNTS